MSMQRFARLVSEGVPAARAEIDSVYWKKDTNVPDYSDQLNRYMEITEGAREDALATYKELQTAQLDETKRQNAALEGVTKQVVDAQLGIMDDTRKQGQEYYDYMKDTFRPVEQGLVKDVEEYNTEAAREQMARGAAGDVERQSAIQREITNRELARMGINPNSGRFMGSKMAQGLQTAGARAGAMTNARERAKEIGYAKKLDIAGLGRGLSGASTSAYGMATGAGNSAVGNQGAQGSFALQGLNTANQYGAQGANTNLNSAQGMMGTIAGLQNNSNNARANQTDLMDVVGLGLGGWAGGGFKT